MTGKEKTTFKAIRTEDEVVATAKASALDEEEDEDEVPLPTETEDEDSTSNDTHWFEMHCKCSSCNFSGF